MRKIIHIDMDAFFAQVEMRDNPEYRNKPIVIGSGHPRYGVVSTCSYEARKFGVRSAMPNIKAYKLCPQAIFVRQDMKKYKAASKKIFKVFYEVTDTVEGLSIDEAYLDVTENKLKLTSATEVAIYIKKRIYEETSLTSSAGVSYNKLLAKLGSEYNKPNGLTIIPPNKAEQFLKTLKLRDIPGIGKSAQERMHVLGIHSIEDLLAFDREQCIKYFNSSGSTLYDYIRGIDNRPVVSEHTQKSIAQETTLHKPYQNIFDSEALLFKFTKATLYTMRKQQTYAKTFSIKIKYGDFTQYTRAITLNYPSNTDVDFTKHIHSLLLKFPFQNKEIRLVGISFSNLVDKQDLSEQNKQQIITQTKLF
ncbi:DNA polymerase IV [Mollicutes bacterium LVI A0039]|nr:DNA polymerase IV [Mollicutes bacterium LVI A0039]